MSTAPQLNNSTNEQAPPSMVQQIGFKEKLGYGFGDLASNIIWTSMGMFLMFYYTEVAGIAAGVIGTIMLISRVFDGVTDIGMGIVVDKTKSRHGKARPWILWMAVPFAIAAVLLFSVPDIGSVGKIIYVAITYNVIIILYTAINIPYGVLNSLITQDQYQRSVLNLFRMSMALGGALLVSMGTLPIVSAFGGGQLGWQLTYGLFGLIGATLFLITFFTTKERVQAVNTENSQIPIKVGIKALFKNKYWVITLFFFTFTNLGAGLGQGTTIYFAQYILGNPGLVGFLSLAGLIPMVVGMILVAPLIKKIGKRNSMVIGLLVVLVGSLVIFIDPTSLTVVIVSGVIKALGTAPVLGAMFALLADTIEYGEWKTGVRTEGLVYSAGSFGAKVGTGLGTAMIGWVLTWGGYIGGSATQSDSAILSINVLFIYIPLAITVIQLVLLMFYKLDKQYPQIINDLQSRSN